MKIKHILLIALLFALPVFSWYLLSNRDVISLIATELKNMEVIVAFLLSALLLLGAHVLRALKTKLLTDSIKHTSWRTHTRALFIGYLFNVLLPLRLGEFIRAFVLGKGTRMSATFMFGLVLLDRAIDGFMLGLFALVLLWQSNVFDMPAIHDKVQVAAYALITVSILVLGMLIIIRRQPAWLLKLCHRITALFNDSMRDSLRFKIWSLMYGLERVLIPGRIIRYLLISACMWIVYVAAIMPLVATFLYEPRTDALAGASTLSYLGVSAPAGPSHIGSYESFVQPFIDIQAETSSVRSALIFTWLLQILPAFAVGLIFVLRTQESFKGPEVREGAKVIEDKLLREVDISHDLGSFLEAFFTNNSLSRIMHRLEIDKDSRLIHYFKGGSSAVTALVYEQDSFLVRKITPAQYKYKLKSQYDWLKDRQEFDKVVNAISEESTDTYYKIDLEYNPEYTPFFDYIHSMPIAKSKQILSEVFKYLNDHIYKPEPLKHRPRNLEAYIEDRCLGKIRQAAEVNDEIRSLLTYNQLIINGETYDNIPQVIDRIKSNKRILKTLATYRRCSIHGDVTIDNILVSKPSDSFLLIDPTDNENEISGPVFDLGRMTQSLAYGYEFLARDEHQVPIMGNRVEFEYSTSSNYAELAKHLQRICVKYLTKDEQQSVLFHAAVLYSRMLTHRVLINPLNAAKFYAVSTIAFNDFLRQIKS